jgi:hypothetical protein
MHTRLHSGLEGSLYIREAADPPKTAKCDRAGKSEDESFESSKGICITCSSEFLIYRGRSERPIRLVCKRIKHRLFWWLRFASMPCSQGEQKHVGVTKSCAVSSSQVAATHGVVATTCYAQRHDGLLCRVHHHELSTRLDAASGPIDRCSRSSELEQVFVELGGSPSSAART